MPVFRCSTHARSHSTSDPIAGCGDHYDLYALHREVSGLKLTSKKIAAVNPSRWTTGFARLSRLLSKLGFELLGRSLAERRLHAFDVVHVFDEARQPRRHVIEGLVSAMYTSSILSVFRKLSARATSTQTTTQPSIRA
jgi:hypothetical protein